MERLERKTVNGRQYYYYSKWGWVDGKCRRIWQKYLGKLEDIAKAVEGGGPPPAYAEVFQWGLPAALWAECTRAKVVDFVDELCPKRDQALSTGLYLAIAAVNRAICAKSKRGMWDWFSQTVLLRHIPTASKTALSSQRFWDHMDRIDGDKALAIWKQVLSSVIEREGIDLSSVCYDGTNFYTFIDTFNMRCDIAKRGKNKQGRCNLRQVSYALFCCSDSQIPLYYHVYDGNRHDAKVFPVVLEGFHRFLKELSKSDPAVPKTTLVFDKGNNSAANFALVDDLQMDFVGSAKLDEHKDLAKISNTDGRFREPSSEELTGTKALRLTKKVYGKKRTVVVTYNQNLFDAQWLTLHADIAKAVEKLAELRQRLDDRASGVISGGRAPTPQFVEGKFASILSRQHLKDVITTAVTQDAQGNVRLTYQVDGAALADLSDTLLGKNIIITNRDDWDEAAIILAYRSQFLIEDVFKQMKDRRTGTWWPMYHWTDSKIMVHGLYCTIAQLLRALMHRRIRQAGLAIPLPRLLSELDTVREVVNVHPKKRGDKKERRQSVLSKTSTLQAKILSALGLTEDRPEANLG
jgi:transposase